MIASAVWNGVPTFPKSLDVVRNLCSVLGNITAEASEASVDVSNRIGSLELGFDIIGAAHGDGVDAADAQTPADKAMFDD